MGFKNFLISIIKSLIIFLLVSLIFSAVTLDVPSLMKNVFGDIFAYASPDAQRQAVSKLAETCASLGKGGNVATISQICTNQSLLESMRENCANYRELKRRDVRIENEAQVKETCIQIESGELEKACSQTNILPDFSKMEKYCEDYKGGKINDREFFLGVISGALPSQAEMPQIGFLEGYNKAIIYLNNNKALYFLALMALLAILYLLAMDIRLFAVSLAGISFSIGIIIMLPYFGILAYEKFAGIDTTPVLGSMFGNGAMLYPKAVISLAILLFLRTYTRLIIMLGIVFLAVGIAGRIYSFALRRKISEREIKELPQKKRKKS